MKKEKNIVQSQGKFYTPIKYSRIALMRLKTLIDIDEYTIWDCACGTGNLLVDFTCNAFGSDIDPISVEIAKNRLFIPQENVFQFDFLNGNKNELPEQLRNTPNEKLLFFVNPPYITTKGGDIAWQFLLKMKNAYKGCKIACFTKALFSKQSDCKFNWLFNSHLMTSIYDPAFVFNSKDFGCRGAFPIIFTIWDTSKDLETNEIDCQIINDEFTGMKTFDIAQ